MSNTTLRTKVLADIREALSNKLGFFERQRDRLLLVTHSSVEEREALAYSTQFILESRKILETLS